MKRNQFNKLLEAAISDLPDPRQSFDEAVALFQKAVRMKLSETCKLQLRIIMETIDAGSFEPIYQGIRSLFGKDPSQLILAQAIQLVSGMKDRGELSDYDYRSAILKACENTVKVTEAAIAKSSQSPKMKDAMTKVINSDCKRFSTTDLDAIVEALAHAVHK